MSKRRSLLSLMFVAAVFVALSAVRVQEPALSPSDAPLSSLVASSSLPPENPADPFAPRPEYPHATKEDLSPRALAVSDDITSCSSDASCIAATLMLNKDYPLDVVAAFSYATSQDGPAANQCHAPSHQLGRVLTVESVAKSPFLAVCSDGLLHGLFETWGSSKTLSQVVSQFPVLCGSLAVNSCAHVAGHALSKSIGSSVPLALEGCATMGIDAMGCSSGIVMLVFDDLRLSGKKPSLSEIDAVCKEFSLPARRDCEGELPWQWELNGLSWPSVITKCEDVSKEGRRSCARGSGRLAYQGSLVSPQVAVSRCQMAQSQDLVESCLGSAASEVGKNAGSLNPGLICNASGALKQRCFDLVNDYS